MLFAVRGGNSFELSADGVFAVLAARGTQLVSVSPEDGTETSIEFTWHQRGRPHRDRSRRKTNARNSDGVSAVARSGRRMLAERR
jgi:hypothetical protein